MARKINRPALLIVTCSAVGVILGGTVSWADSIYCLQAETPTNQCLTQSSTARAIDGMGAGLLAGSGAAIGAIWQLKQKN